MSLQGYDPDDDDEKGSKPQKRFSEFECPGCDANNPVDPPVGNTDEVLCNYCGCEYQVRVDDEGNLKLKAL
jgi:transcription elongation factor Elf1